MTWRAYQADGAGYYVVIDADDGRDFVFMHLKDGSITVAKDDAGQRRPGVRAGRHDRAHARRRTCTSRSGPTGWYSSDDAQPVDPRPGSRRLGARRELKTPKYSSFTDADVEGA